MLVCLGIEDAARDWIERHNRQHPINRIHIIELRTDRKAGGVIRHEPMSARVRIEQDDQVPRPARRATDPDFRYGALIGYPNLRSPYRTDGSR